MMRIDLTAFAKHLAKEGKHVPLREAIKRYSSAKSVHQDLIEAKNYLSRLPSVMEMSDPDRSQLGGALLLSAVMMYMRASTGNDGRSHVDFARRFSPELKQKHADIDGLRNTVIAHFGNARGRYASDWTREAAYFVVAEPGPPVGFILSRTNFTAELIADISLLVKKAVRLVEAEVQNRTNDLVEALMKLPYLDKEVLDQAFMFELDPNKIAEGTVANESGELVVPPFEFKPRPDVKAIRSDD